MMSCFVHTIWEKVSCFLFWPVLTLRLWRQNYREAEGGEMNRKGWGSLTCSSFVCHMRNGSGAVPLPAGGQAGGGGRLTVPGAGAADRGDEPREAL